jgi:hypothetical protein
VPVLRQEQVLGLEIAVHDPLRVRRRETARDLQREFVAEVEDREDVRVRQRGDGLRLAPETGQPLAITRDGRRQHLDRDVALQLRVPRPVHLAHPPGPERGDDLVRTEPCARNQRHWTSAAGDRRQSQPLEGEARHVDSLSLGSAVFRCGPEVACLD